MFEIRATTKPDIAAVDALLARSYPVLLKADYSPSVLVTALPLISKAQPGLVTCGTYFGVFDDGTLVGAGGWTRAAPGGAQRDESLGHIRHVVTDHRRIRSGIGRALMAHILKDAKQAGVTQMACQSTLTAERYYAAMGFERLRPITVPLRPGIDFPAIAMQRPV